MKTTDRSPLKGQKVKRNFKVCRKYLTEISKKLRLPRLSARALAVAASSIAVCAAIVLISVIGGRSMPVKAADINIGAETELSGSLSGGAGRFTETSDEAQFSDTEASPSGEAGSDASADAASDAALSAQSSTDDTRYTVTFAFHSRESISCSAEKPASVGELAERLGIVFGDTDVLNISADTVISEDTVITTDKVTYGTERVSTAIAYTTKYIDDSSLRSGTTKVSQYGQNGETITEYSVKYVNGVEESRTEVSSYTAKNPVEQVIRRGTAVYKPPTSSAVVEYGGKDGGTFVGGDGKTYTYSYYVDVSAVMYYSGGGTRIGLPADENIIAVDPSVIPLGSQVYITGSYADIGVRTAADTGTAIKGNIIDICFDRDNPLAQNFGRRAMRVYILK